ncbi:aspartic peptidase domain-containing protein [Apiosordaria backusii]|uniref:Aspartic peptidase domain-containing protein n=1 Tax=Apiosordaria backusii TaxID=314023 RepID=A0AA40EFI1_9PEZI|nr:aspartic peptidase domain-containing protein [Apiosordaria backusii]
MKWAPLALFARTAFAAGTIQVQWTTDVTSPSDRADQRIGMYGPDGPWQALWIDVGPGKPLGSMTNFNAMWPSGGGTTMVLTRQVPRGNYTANHPGNFSSADNKQVSDDWMSDVFVNQTALGSSLNDTVIFSGPLGVTARVDTRVYAIDDWAISMSDGRNRSAEVGILGLGSGIIGPSKSGGVVLRQDGILQQLKGQQNKIGSMSFALHMGSVQLDQRGSMILGGYEQNRALGTVGMFDYQQWKIPSMFLIDVLLGTQIGGSPFERQEDEGSIWRGPGNNTQAPKTTKNLGGKQGSVSVTINPAAPYIYLPLGTCEEAARRLPVSWNDQLGLFTWNTNDPRYQGIVSSPAYLAFVLADRTAKNITIKVPMRLLNLTLESPLVSVPTPYFPCKPFDPELGHWMLGRAFLQAAFFGINYDQNLTFLAQAPGPDMAQRVVREIDSGNPTIEANPIEEFESSWRSSWTILETSQPEPNVVSPSNTLPVLSTGALVGVIVGACVMVAVLVAFGIWFWRKKNSESKSSSEETGEDLKPDQTQLNSDAQLANEMCAKSPASEIGSPLPHELEVVNKAQEVATELQYFELPGDGLDGVKGDADLKDGKIPMILPT